MIKQPLKTQDSGLKTQPFAFSTRSFTLVELLAVIGIIVLLAGVILSTATYVNRKSLEAKTKSQLHQITLALEMYKNWAGYYPIAPSVAAREYSISHKWDSSTTNNNMALYRALTNRDSTGAFFLEIKADQIQANGVTTNFLVDPYGNLWGYFSAADAISRTNQYNQRSYDLWSFGLSLTDPTNSLISNWRQQ